MCLLISEISLSAVDLLYVSAGKRGKKQRTKRKHWYASFGALSGQVFSVLVLLELNKMIVRKLSLCVIIMEFP